MGRDSVECKEKQKKMEIKSKDPLSGFFLFLFIDVDFD